MFDFGFSEILLTSAIALVVLGPERLPKVARQVGNWLGRARAMARQLSEQLDREVSADELMRQHSRPASPGAAAPTPETAAGDEQGAQRPATAPTIPPPYGAGDAAPVADVGAPKAISPPND